MNSKISHFCESLEKEYRKAVNEGCLGDVSSMIISCADPGIVHVRVSNDSVYVSRKICVSDILQSYISHQQLAKFHFDLIIKAYDKEGEKDDDVRLNETYPGPGL